MPKTLQPNKNHQNAISVPIFFFFVHDRITVTDKHFQTQKLAQDNDRHDRLILHSEGDGSPDADLESYLAARRGEGNTDRSGGAAW